MRRETLRVVLLSLCAFTWNACGSSGSPTAPSVPPADFAAQFDSLWSTFDREYSYFDHKQIDWNALRTTFRPRAIAATDQTQFIGVIREMLGHLHDLHVVLRNPSGGVLGTFDPQSFVNWDQSVWMQYIGRANWTQGQGDWVQVIEDVGISPRVFVAAAPGDFMQGRDPVLDWALNARPD